jgi:hypothetical protein
MTNPISLYSVALFLHIMGALGLFVALGLEWTSLLNLRRASTSDQAREWLKLYASLRRLYPLSWLLILIPGFYMAATAWGGAAWISIALGAVILLVILGIALGGRLMAPVGQALSSESGPLSASVRQRISNPLLWASLWIRTAIALGIVFLMTVKPDLYGALITMGVAILLGLVASLPARGRDREKIQVKQASDRL